MAIRKMLLSKEELEERLYVQGKTQQEVADEADVHLMTLRDHLKKLGIKGRVHWVKQTHLTKDNLTRLYVDEGMSMSEIGDLYDVSVDVVKNQLVVHSVPLRDRYQVTERRRQKSREIAMSNPYFGKGKIPNANGEYECSTCHEWLAEDEFCRPWMCKTCNCEAVKAWQRKNPDRIRVIFASKQANNFGVVDTLTEDEWKAIRVELNDLCFYCGAPFEHLEHIVPMSQGGPNSKGNVVTACRKCNQTKNAAKTELLVALALVRKAQLGDQDFAILNISERDFAETTAQNANALVSGVLTRLTNFGLAAAA